jgi:ubiquitin carboxyl-terminal hydrolase 16
MPERQTVTYAVGASLAAIVAIYVFAPSFPHDHDSASASSRKKNVVGLVNPANDCFINSVLQALAGLGDMRLYLIRETHRRKLDGPEVYLELVVDPARRNMPPWKIEGLQAGMVTRGLKEILDKLNERPIQKKSISAAPFVQCLEAAFKQRISRQQQDAQEFLQVVAERLCDEYHAGHRARKHARKSTNGTNLNTSSLNGTSPDATSTSSPTEQTSVEQNLNRLALEDGEQLDPDDAYPKEDGFPLEGVSESQIECLTCGFKPRSTKSTFCSLTLSVPERNSSLSSMFDQMFKTEYIEDFKCEKCRLQHALETFQQEVSKSTSDKFKANTQKAIDKIEVTLETNPEEELMDVELPDKKFAPKRRIAKHVQIYEFPKIIAIHLSRSIHDSLGNSASKNSSKVTFEEKLSLGGLTNRRTYRLSSIVCHKGSHQSGHYETFRRQAIPQHFSTPNPFQPSAVYGKPPTPNPSQISTPQVEAAQRSGEASADSSTLSSTPEMLSPASASSSSPSLPHTNGHQHINGHALSPMASGSTSMPRNSAPTSAPRDSETSSIRSLARSARSNLSKVSRSKASGPSPPAPSTEESEDANRRAEPKETNGTPKESKPREKKRKHSNRWWRISDEKIKEAKTGDVLAMQREVYLLFYELEKDE